MRDKSFVAIALKQNELIDSNYAPTHGCVNQSEKRTFREEFNFQNN